MPVYKDTSLPFAPSPERIALALSLVVVLVALVAGCGVGASTTRGGPASLTGYLSCDASGANLLIRPAPGDGTPLSGAAVCLWGVPGSETTSGPDGAFLISDAPPGRQILQVSPPGYTALQFPLLVSSGVSSLTATLPGGPARHRWTVLVYLDADNSLDDVAESDLDEMERAGSSPDVAVVAQVDRIGAWNTRRYAIVHDDAPGFVSPVVQNLGEVNMGDPATLRDFLAWGQREYPAEHYLLILWDHGSGWDPADRSPTSSAGRSIANDDTSGDTLTVTELPAALRAPSPLDIIAADACLMGMLEVSYELRERGTYYVASEELVPRAGLDYAAFLPALHAVGATAEPREVATLLAEHCARSWGSGGDQTASAVDLRLLAPVASALDSLASRLCAVGRYQSAAALSAQRDADRYGDSSRDVRADLADYADLLAERSPDARTRTLASALSAAVDAAVVANFVGPYHPRARGIAIFLPTGPRYYGAGQSTRYPPPVDTYPDLALTRDTRWNEWLARQPY